MAKKPINNALSNYDNTVEETPNGKAGFVSNILSGGLSLSSIKNAATNLSSALTGKVGDFLSAGITKLNQLASGLLGKIPGLDGLLRRLNGFLNSKLSSANLLMKSMLKDATKQLENAAINYIQNIVEDFTNNILSTMFIPDKVFCETIKLLYYTGADLAYDNHYIRNMALSRDWVYTLEFVDEQYNIKYNIEYKYLDKDLNTCSSNSCAENLFYIYEKIIDSLEDCKSQKINYQGKINNIITSYNNNEKKYKNDPNYINYTNVIKKLDSDINNVEELLVYHLKNLIINSYTYVNVSRINRFFTDLKGNYLFPKYYGTNDDKYSGKYKISESDCIHMMPDFIQHETTESDKDYLVNANNDKENLKKQVEEAEFEAFIHKEINRLVPDRKTRLQAKANEAITNFRKNTLNKQIDRHGILSSSAIKGSNAVYEVSKSRYPKQNELPDSVKYKKNITGAFGTAAKEMLYNDTEYIELRNKNIKEIYVLLSSNAIFGNNRMINEAFYLRCKIPTMTNLVASLDKAKGILGTSMAVQGLFDIQNTIDQSAYVYLLKVEDYLLDPKVNNDDIKNIIIGQFTNPDDVIGSFDSSTGTPDSSTGTPDSSTGTPDNTNGSTTGSSTGGTTNIINGLITDSSNGSNKKNVDYMEKLLTSNPALNQEVISVIRYIANIPMVTMRDTMIKWLTIFYNFMNKKQVSKQSISHSFSNLCEYVFGVHGISEPSSLNDKVFNSSNKDSLIENTKSLIFLYKASLASKAMKLETISEKDTINNLFYICMSMFSREISDIGFTKSLFQYDKEFLKTYLKSYYYKEIEFLKGINDKSKQDYKMFYPYKDKLTTRFEGFDKFGIFGYNENIDRLQYTNVFTGDWKKIFNSSKGVFFGGTENTKNNGIKRLNADKTEVISTNINDGNWIDIFEFFGTVFFLIDTDELYYWTGSKVETTGIKDYSNWEISTIDEYGIIVLLGKNNNGIRRWLNNNFAQSVVSKGDGWYIQKSTYFGYCIFPTGNASNPVYVNRSKNFTTVNVSDSFTYTGETFRSVTVTGSIQSQSTDPKTGTTKTETTTKNKTSTMYYVIFGTKTNGLKIFNSDTMNGSNLREYTVNNELTNVNSGIGIPNSTMENTLFYIRDNGEYRVTFETSMDKNSGQVSSEASIIIEPRELYLTITENTRTKEFNSIDNIILTKYSFLFHDSGNNKNYNKVISENTIYDFDSSLNISDGRAYLYEPNNTEYWEFNHKKGLYRLENTSIVSLLNNTDKEKTGWKMYYVNNKLFAVNIENPIGIRVFDNNSFINTNISDGIWILGGSNKRYFALSTKNTNKGIKVCNYSAKTINFVDIPKTSITYGDYSGIAFDNSSNKLFLGNERSDLILNLDLIDYDIDSFIYPLHEYILQQLIAGIVMDKLGTLTDFISNMIENGDDSFILSSVLTEKLMNVTVDGKTLREALMSITDAQFIDKYESLSNPLDKAKYLLENIDKYPQLLPFRSMLEQFIEENKNFVDILGMMNNMESFSRDMQRKSALFTELLVHSEAKKEFNITDEKAIDSIIVDFLNNIKYNGNVDEFYGAISRYKADNIKIYGLINYDKDGNQITIDKNSPEYKMEHYADSDEFMNSDENGIV